MPEDLQDHPRDTAQGLDLAAVELHAADQPLEPLIDEQQQQQDHDDR